MSLKLTTLDSTFSGPSDQQDGGPIVGIDLGTTNSLVAYVPNVAEDGSTHRQPVIIRSPEGKSLVPSVVSFVHGKPVVGQEAKRHKVRDAEHTVFSVKRLLGRGFDDLKGTAN
ncbi:MAG TPA: Hsp70 family protein, partial [Bdellovibrionota bacterium]|nr:Hsp70 family protein [Bdellovibrionota bacterium]